MDWFKMQTIWGASVRHLSDAEAGRFVKALFAFVRDGVETLDGYGQERLLIAQALETLRSDKLRIEAQQAADDAARKERSEKRRAAAMKRWMQNDANAIACMQMDNSASACMQMDAKCTENQNKNQNQTGNEETPQGCIAPARKQAREQRFAPPTVEEVAAYCRERGNKVDAQRFVDFYASKGWKVGNQPMKDWRAAVRNWERDRASPAKTVSAHQYGQRDYTEEELLAVSGDMIAEARNHKGV